MLHFLAIYLTIAVIASFYDHLTRKRKPRKPAPKWIWYSLIPIILGLAVLGAVS